MDVCDIIARLWTIRLRALTAAVMATAVALALTYHVSLKPFGLRPGGMQLAVAQTQVLVDAGHSPLGDSASLLDGINLVAGDFAEIADSPQIVEAAARSIHVSPNQIEVQQQLEQQAVAQQRDPGEAQRANQLLSTPRPYWVVVRNDQGTFILQIYTQAPTAAVAIALANATASAYTQYAHRLAVADAIPLARRIILRQLGPATGGVIDPHAPVEAAAVIAVVLWLLLLIPLLRFSAPGPRRSSSAPAAGPARPSARS